MNSLLLRCARPLALCLSFFVTAEMTAAALPVAQQQNQPDAGQESSPTAQPAQQPAQQPEAQPAGNGQAQPPASPAQQPDAQQAPAATPQSPEASPGLVQRGQDIEQRDAQNPVGTAVAPYTRPTGVAGSRPAGAAIAPAKQRRVKAIFIRVGLIVAAAAAAGAVIGLSKGSPSHPQ